MVIITNFASNLVLESDGNVFTIGADGTGKTYLTDDGPGYVNALAAWSYDGSRIIYMRQAPNDLPRIWSMRADGSDKVQLTSGALYGTSDTFSPDGQSVLFSSTATGNSELWLMSADGASPHLLTTTTVSGITRTGETIKGSSSGSYSPDGKRIIYASTQSGHSEIWVMNSDGSGQTQLTFPTDANAPDANVPAWSRDGSKIVFFGGFEGEYGNIYTMNADGSGRTQLTSETGTNSSDNPAWSPDGKYILFQSNRDGPIETWIMNADGTGRVVLSSDSFFSSRLPVTARNETIIGAAGDTITGGLGLTWIDGSAGGQTISGGAGSNLIIGGPGDIIIGSTGPGTAAINGARGDAIIGGSGWDWIDGGIGGQAITGGPGHSTIIGGPGDVIFGSTGSGTSLIRGAVNDAIMGGYGSDWIDGAAGWQAITGGPGHSTIIGGAGDVIFGSTTASGAASIIGAVGDAIMGGSGNDSIDGRAGNQPITGGSGNTTMSAAGGDTVFGGPGNLTVNIDHTQFAGAVKIQDAGVQGYDTVVGFSQSAGDRLSFPNETAAAIDSVVGSAHTNNGNTILTLPDGATVTLVGITHIDSSFFA